MNEGYPCNFTIIDRKSRRVDMEISLIRHGRSQLIENDKVNSSEFKQWVEKYDSNGVFEESIYPSVTIDKIKNAKIIVTSDLERAIHSAKLLKPEEQLISDVLFRETELPIGRMKDVKLKPSTWTVLLRLLWFFGYSNGCESFHNAKIRAIKASIQLMDYAEEYKTVVLVGHGFFNRLVAKELQKKGWEGKRKTGAKHWIVLYIP